MWAEVVHTSFKPNLLFYLPCPLKAFHQGFEVSFIRVWNLCVCVRKQLKSWTGERDRLISSGEGLNLLNLWIGNILPGFKSVFKKLAQKKKHNLSNFLRVRADHTNTEGLSIASSGSSCAPEVSVGGQRRVTRWECLVSRYWSSSIVPFPYPTHDWWWAA